MCIMVLQFPPTYQRHEVRLIDNTKIVHCMRISLHILYLCYITISLIHNGWMNMMEFYAAAVKLRNASTGF